MYVKVCILYSAVSSLLDRSKRFTCLTLWPTCSFRHQLYVSWKNSAMLQLLPKDYSPTFPLLSVSRYSFIQLNKLGSCKKTKMLKLRDNSKGDSNSGSLNWLRVCHPTAEGSGRGLVVRVLDSGVVGSIPTLGMVRSIDWEFVILPLRGAVVA